MYQTAEWLILSRDSYLGPGSFLEMSAATKTKHKDWNEVPMLGTGTAGLSPQCEGIGDLLVSLQALSFPPDVLERMRLYFCDAIEPSGAQVCGLESLELLGIADDGTYLYGPWVIDDPHHDLPYSTWICSN